MVQGDVAELLLGVCGDLVGTPRPRAGVLAAGELRDPPRALPHAGAIRATVGLFDRRVHDVDGMQRAAAPPTSVPPRNGAAPRRPGRGVATVGMDSDQQRAAALADARDGGIRVVPCGHGRVREVGARRAGGVARSRGGAGVRRGAGVGGSRRRGADGGVSVGWRRGADGGARALGRRGGAARRRRGRRRGGGVFRRRSGRGARGEAARGRRAAVARAGV